MKIKLLYPYTDLETSSFDEESGAIKFLFANGEEESFPIGENISEASELSILFSDGIEIDLTDFSEAYGFEDFITAAGPATSSTSLGSGSGDYSDDGGALIDGVDRLGTLGNFQWDRASQGTEIEASADSGYLATALTSSDLGTPDTGAPDVGEPEDDAGKFRDKAIINLQRADGDDVSVEISFGGLDLDSIGSISINGESCPGFNGKAGGENIEITFPDLIEGVSFVYEDGSFLAKFDKSLLSQEDLAILTDGFLLDYIKVQIGDEAPFYLQLVITDQKNFDSSMTNEDPANDMSLAGGLNEYHGDSASKENIDYKISSEVENLYLYSTVDDASIDAENSHIHLEATDKGITVQEKKYKSELDLKEISGKDIDIYVTSTNTNPKGQVAGIYYQKNSPGAEIYLSPLNLTAQEDISIHAESATHTYGILVNYRSGDEGFSVDAGGDLIISAISTKGVAFGLYAQSGEGSVEINAGGDISIHGAGGTSKYDSYGIFTTNTKATEIISEKGNITISALKEGGIGEAIGVEVADAENIIKAEAGNIKIQVDSLGTGNAYGVLSWHNDGKNILKAEEGSISIDVNSKSGMSFGLYADASSVDPNENELTASEISLSVKSEASDSYAMHASGKGSNIIGRSGSDANGQGSESQNYLPEESGIKVTIIAKAGSLNEGYAMWAKGENANNQIIGSSLKGGRDTINIEGAFKVSGEKTSDGELKLGTNSISTGEGHDHISLNGKIYPAVEYDESSTANFLEIDAAYSLKINAGDGIDILTLTASSAEEFAEFYKDWLGADGKGLLVEGGHNIEIIHVSGDYLDQMPWLRDLVDNFNAHRPEGENPILLVDDNDLASVIDGFDGDLSKGGYEENLDKIVDYYKDHQDMAGYDEGRSYAEDSQDLGDAGILDAGLIPVAGYISSSQDINPEEFLANLTNLEQDFISNLSVVDVAGTEIEDIIGPYADSLQGRSAHELPAGPSDPSGSIDEASPKGDAGGQASLELSLSSGVQDLDDDAINEMLQEIASSYIG